MNPGDRPDDWSPPDVEGLLGDEPELMSTAREVHRALHASAIDPDFQQRLRSDLLAERGREQEGGIPRPVGLLRSRPRRLALVAAAAVITAAVGVGLAARPWATSSGPSPVAVGVTANVSGDASADPNAPVVVHFDQPMNQASVEAALRLSPATAVTKQWRGSDLVLTATNGFAPNVPYVVTVLGDKAKTATGAPLSSDQHVVFGTSSFAIAVGPTTPVAVDARTVVTADDGSEAVVLADGSLVATAAGTGGRSSGLVRIGRSGTQQIAPATAAICVSRSGHSLAYLAGGTGATSIVVAAGDGSSGRPLPAKVDDGSPLGWINDDKVSFISGGRLTAIDRSGRIQVLSPDRVDAAHDTVVIAPGGRFVFLRPAGQDQPGDGVLIDLVGGGRRNLPGIVGDPAFDGTGSTVVWVQVSGTNRRLALAAAGGGPVRHTSLPVAVGDEVGGLGVSPDGGRLVYSVTHQDHSAELRIASLADGTTLAVSGLGAGDSPNWSPGGDRVAVLGHRGGTPEIRLVNLPPALAPAGSLAEAAATAFANAQISGDQQAQQALGKPGLTLPHVVASTRATVIQVTQTSETAVDVDLRLVTDPTPAHPVGRAINERLSLQITAGSQVAVVENVKASDPHDLAPGPHVTRVDATAGVVSIRFDSDLDARSIAAAVSIRNSDGSTVAAQTSYEAGTRTVVIRLTAPGTGTVSITFGSGLRDIAGQALATAIHTVVSPSG